MRFLSFVYRFITNFAFLAAVYVSLNYIDKYNNRAIPRQFVYHLINEPGGIRVDSNTAGRAV